MNERVLVLTGGWKLLKITPNQIITEHPLGPADRGRPHAGFQRAGCSHTHPVAHSSVLPPDDPGSEDLLKGSKLLPNHFPPCTENHPAPKEVQGSYHNSRWILHDPTAVIPFVLLNSTHAE